MRLALDPRPALDRLWLKADGRAPIATLEFSTKSSERHSKMRVNSTHSAPTNLAAPMFFSHYGRCVGAKPESSAPRTGTPASSAKIPQPKTDPAKSRYLTADHGPPTTDG